MKTIGILAAAALAALGASAFAAEPPAQAGCPGEQHAAQHRHGHGHGMGHRHGEKHDEKQDKKDEHKHS
jgi:Spy/CpxP family protein refolding chaperone